MQSFLLCTRAAELCKTSVARGAFRAVALRRGSLTVALAFVFWSAPGLVGAEALADATLLVSATRNRLSLVRYKQMANGRVSQHRRLKGMG